MLTDDQEKAYQSILAHQLVYVSGPAGTGKSYLIHHLQQTLQANSTPYFTLSSTGISAHHSDGMTVHSFLIRLRLKLLTMTKETVLIVDEISMLGKRVFDQLETALRRTFSDEQYFDPRDRTNPFGGCKVIFFGDFAQLPPIDDEFCFASDAWGCIQAHCELTTIKRQTEASFQQFLSRVRTGKLTADDRQTILKKLSLIRLNTRKKMPLAQRY